MKEKIEEILIRFKHRFYKWIYEDDLRNANGDIDAPKMEKDLSDFIGQELSTLIQEEREETVRGFITDFIETGVYEGVGSIEDIMKLWRKYNAHN